MSSAVPMSSAVKGVIKVQVGKPESRQARFSGFPACWPAGLLVEAFDNVIQSSLRRPAAVD
jgi:hypothetical protein